MIPKTDFISDRANLTNQKKCQAFKESCHTNPNFNTKNSRLYLAIKDSKQVSIVMFKITQLLQNISVCINIEKEDRQAQMEILGTLKSLCIYKVRIAKNSLT